MRSISSSIVAEGAIVTMMSLAWGERGIVWLFLWSAGLNQRSRPGYWWADARRILLGKELSR